MKKILFWSLIILALGIALHIGMTKDKEAICANEATAYEGC